MEKILWFTVSLLLLHGIDSYILLTANMEDVQSVMKQLSSSPVMEQVKQIWRRATSQFKQELKKPLRRGRLGTDSKLGERDEQDEGNARRRNADALLSLSTATEYVESAKQFIDSLKA